MIKTTRWTSDICGCVIDYDWDDSVSEDVRTHTGSKSVSKCAAHAAAADISTHYGAVLGENNRRNRIFADVMSNFPALTQTDKEGNIVFKNGAVNFSFDANRVLQISIIGLNAAQKTTLQNLANSKFGANKVNIT